MERRVGAVFMVDPRRDSCPDATVLHPQEGLQGGILVRLKSVVVLLCTLCLFCVASVSFAADPVHYIKRSNFKKCPYKTVAQAIDAAFENPRWEAGTAEEDGSVIVDVRGVITWQGKRYNAWLQFQPTTKGFKTNGISLNGKQQSDKFLSTFVDELCN
jgi:hypothetical protein